MSDAYLEQVLGQSCHLGEAERPYLARVARRIADVVEQEVARLGEAGPALAASIEPAVALRPQPSAELPQGRADAIYAAACLVTLIMRSGSYGSGYRYAGKGHFYTMVLQYMVSSATPVTAALLARCLGISEHTPHLSLCAPAGAGEAAVFSTTLGRVEADPFLREYAQIQLEEDRMRRDFADRNLEALGPWDACVPLSTLPASESGLLVPPLSAPLYCGSSFHRAAACVAEQGAPGDLERMREILASTPAVVDFKTFQRNWELLTNGLLDGLDWSNVVAAGGSVLACLLPGFVAADYGKEGDDFLAALRTRVFELTYNKQVPLDPHCICALNGFHTADIDLFFYGLDEAQARRKTEEIIRLVEKNQGRAILMRSGQALTIFAQNPHRDVQIVFRLYSRPCEVIHGFDIDCVAVAYDGREAYLSRRALAALRARTNVVNTTRRSTTYGSRLIKYAYRGFAISAPGFSRRFGVPSAVPAGARASTSLQAWAASGADRHTCSAAEYRYMTRLGRLWEDARLARTRAGHDLTSIISEDLVMWHADLCLGKHVHPAAAEEYCRYGRLAAGYLFAVRNPGAGPQAATEALNAGWGTAGSGAAPVASLEELLAAATARHIGGYEAASCSCRVAVDQRVRVLEFCAAVCARNRTEDRATIRRLREERRLLAGEARAVLGAESLASELVEREADDAGRPVQYRKAEPVSRELDPLSIAFSYQHDYATPCSNGFHTKDALDWAEQNPRAYGSLRIGTAEFALLGPAAPRAEFLLKNPGKQGLMTSSFQPLDDAGFYGDFRVLLGRDAFETADPGLHASFPGYRTTDAVQGAPGERVLLKVFCLNHFISVPFYLSSVYSESANEAAAQRDIAEAEEELRKAMEGDGPATHKLAALSLFAERKLRACRQGLEACERAVAEMETFNSDSITYPHGRRVRNWTEDAMDVIRTYISAVRGLGTPAARVQADLCDRVLASCVRDEERRADLQRWVERHREAEAALRDTRATLRSLQAALLAGKEFAVPGTALRVAPANTALCHDLYAGLAALNCELVFGFSDVSGAPLPLEPPAPEEGSWGDVVGAVSLAAGPVSGQEARFSVYLNLSSPEAPDGVRRFLALCGRMADRKTTVYVLPDFSAALFTFAIADSSLSAVLEASAAPDEPLFLLWAALDLVLACGARFAPGGSNFFVGERGRVCAASFLEAAPARAARAPRQALEAFRACAPEEQGRRLASARELAKLFSRTFRTILGEEAELTRALSAEPLEAEGLGRVADALPGLQARPYEELRIPRCAMFNTIAKAVGEGRARVAETCVVPEAPDKARKFLGAFSFPCKTAAELSRRRILFCTQAGAPDSALSDARLGFLLSASLRQDGLAGEALDPAPGPLSEYAIDVWTRVGRLLSWAFLQGRKPGILFPPYVYKALLRGGSCVYTPESVGEALFDSGPTSEVHRTVLELLAMRELPPPAQLGRYSFQAAESGATYRLGARPEQSDEVEADAGTGFCVYISDPRAFACHYATEMLFTRRAASLGCLCRGWAEAGIEQVILSRTGVAGLSFLNAQQFRSMFMEGGEAVPSMEALRSCFACGEEEAGAVDAFLAALGDGQLNRLSAALQAQPGGQLRVRVGAGLEEPALQEGELLLPAEREGLGAKLVALFGLE